MAKPLSVASVGASSSSKYLHRPSKKKVDPSYRLWRRSSKQPLSTFVPSSGVLSLLATIVSTSSVHGSPIPPPFLCPAIDSEGIENCTIIERALPSDATNVRVARHIPDRFSKEADGIWRRVASYTLYGSTMPTCASGTCSQPTAMPSSIDDQIQAPDSQNDTTISSSSLTNVNMEDLPPGWKPVPKASAGRTTLILSLSLVLAFFICSFIVGCLFWRKHVKKHRSKELEDARTAKKRNENEDESTEALVEKEAKVKQKVWARATARWKANVRYSARQRRGKRISRMSQPHQSSLSFDSSRNHLPGSVSVSRSSSRRSSMVSVRDQPQSTPTLPTVVSATSLEENLHVSPLGETPALPPAYQHHGQIPPIIVSSEGNSTDSYSGFTTPTQTDRSRRPSHSSINSPSSIIAAGQNRPLISLLSAHVATDDKSLLARLAELASAPPVDGSQDSTGIPGSAQISVPTWQDEDIEDYALTPSNNSSPTGEPSMPPMFPPPPSKETLAAAEFYDYPYAFDEMGTPDLEPSAPPFEEGSAPPLEVAPSAPPLLDESEFLEDSQPSAPEWDSASQLGAREEITPGQDHDRIPSSNPPSQAPSLSGTPLPNRDSVVLPIYQP